MGNESAAIIINGQDSVAVATRDIKAGEKIPLTAGGQKSELLIKNDIKFLHKFALRDIPKGDKVLKYGMVIGEATADISRGEHVHVHNVRSLRG